MSSRRHILGCIAATSIAGAGCTDLSNSDGTAVRFGAIEYPDGEIVARTVREVEYGDEWVLHADALVYEQSNGQHVLFSSHRVLNQGDSDEWGYTGIDEFHDWTVGTTAPSLHSWDSNTEPVDDDMAQGRRSNRSARDIGRWEIRLSSPSTAVMSHQFLTTVGGQLTPEDGDLLVENRSTFHFDESGLLGNSAYLEFTLELVYDDIDG